MAGEAHKVTGLARVIAASSTGTAFEWYDFFIFGSLAQIISRTFFAGLDATASLIRKPMALLPTLGRAAIMVSAPRHMPPVR